MEGFEEQVDEEFSEVLTGNTDPDSSPVFDDWMLFQIKHPEIAAELEEFKHLTEKRGEISSKISEFESRRDQLDEQISELAEKLQKELYHV